MTTTGTPAATTFATFLETGDLKVEPCATRARVGQEYLEAASPAELRAQLAASIYTTFHSRHSDQNHSPAENLDQELQARLAAAIPHQWVVQPATAATQSAGTHDTHATVLVGGVKVTVPAQNVIRNQQGSVAGARFPSWRTRTTPGYLLALSAKGIEPGRISRLYISRDTVIQTLALWEKLLHQLNHANIGYQVKALSTLAGHPRTDAVVVYVNTEELPAAHMATTTALSALTPASLPPSVFTQTLSTNVSTADEPSDRRPGYTGLSFGQHRSRVLADALIEAATNTIPVAVAWERHAQLANIDALSPGLNHAQ